MPLTLGNCHADKVLADQLGDTEHRSVIHANSIEFADGTHQSSAPSQGITIAGTPPSNWIELAVKAEMATEFALKQDSIPGNPPTNWSTLATDASVTALASTVGTNTTNLSNVTASVSANTSDITALTSSDSALSASVSTLSTTVATNGGAISTLQSSVGTN